MGTVIKERALGLIEDLIVPEARKRPFVAGLLAQMDG